VTPAHSHAIGDEKMKVAAPGGSENAISAAHGFRSEEDAEFLLSQADDGIGTPRPTSSNNKPRHLSKNDGSYKNGGALGLSPAGERTSEASPPPGSFNNQTLHPTDTDGINGNGGALEQCLTEEGTSEAFAMDEEETLTQQNNENYFLRST
jgi:hypothetical protein